MFWSGWGEDCEGMEIGRCWTGDGGAAICVAPAKGATEATCETEGKLLISIHAPAPRGISPCMNCSVSNMPAKKTTLNYSKLLKISVKSYRFY